MNPISQKTLDRLSSLTGSVEGDLDHEQQGVIGDVVDAGQKGVYDGVAGAAETFGASDTRDWALDKSQQQTDSMSDVGRGAMNKPFFTEDEQGHHIGEALTDPRAIVMQAAHMMGLNADILAGGALVKGGRVVVGGLAKAVRKKLGGKIKDPKLLKEAEQTATKAYLDSVINYGTATHAIAGGLQAIDVRNEVNDMDYDELEKSPMFVQAVRNLRQQNPDIKATELLNAARSRLADEAANRVKTNPALLTSNYLVGGLGGFALERMLMGKIPKAVGVANEIVTEGIQGSTEQFAANQEIQATADPDRDLSEGVVTSGLNEAAAGGFSAAGMAGGRAAFEKIAGVKPQEPSIKNEGKQQGGKEAEQQEGSAAGQQDGKAARRQGSGMPLAGSFWNDYFKERYQGEAAQVDEATGEVQASSARPAYLMSDQGTPFANEGQAKQFAAQYGLSDYTPVKTKGGFVMERPAPALPDVPLSSTEESVALTRQLRNEALRRKSSGEFLNAKALSRAYSLIGSKASPEEVKNAMDMALVDPQRAAIDKWNNEKNPAPVVPEPVASVPEIEPEPVDQARQWLQSNTFSQEQLERDSNFDKVQAPSPTGNKQTDYDSAMLQKEVQNLRPAARAGIKKLFTNKAVPRPSVTDVAKRVKSNRKSIKRTLYQRGIDPNVSQKLNAVLATYTKPIKEAAGYQPNQLFADALSNVTSIKKAIAKAPDPEQQQQRVSQALMDMYMEAEQEWYQNVEQDDFDVFSKNGGALEQQQGQKAGQQEGQEAGQQEGQEAGQQEGRAAEQQEGGEAEFDTLANSAATSATNDLPAPTDAQKEAGNYKKGHVRVHGLDIAIENPKGSKRTGVAPDGKPWESTMAHHYGDIKGTKGADGDAIDVFIGKDIESDMVFVVNQVDPNSGAFDEHKVMLGFDSQTAAEQGYLANYEKDWQGMDSVVAMPSSEFKTWLAEGDTLQPADQKTSAVKQPEGNDDVQENPNSNSNKRGGDDSRSAGEQRKDSSRQDNVGQSDNPAVSRPGDDVSITGLPGESNGNMQTDGADKSVNDADRDVPTTPSSSKLVIAEHSDKAFIVVDPNRSLAERIKSLKASGAWMPKKKGWVFSKKRQAEVQAMLDEVNQQSSKEAERSEGKAVKQQGSKAPEQQSAEAAGMNARKSFHGTLNNFDSLEIVKGDTALFGDGIYLTTSQDDATGYSSNATNSYASDDGNWNRDLRGKVEAQAKLETGEKHGANFDAAYNRIIGNEKSKQGAVYEVEHSLDNALVIDGDGIDLTDTKIANAFDLALSETDNVNDNTQISNEEKDHIVRLLKKKGNREWTPEHKFEWQLNVLNDFGASKAIRQLASILNKDSIIIKNANRYGLVKEDHRNIDIDHIQIIDKKAIKTVKKLLPKVKNETRKNRQLEGGAAGRQEGREAERPKGNEASEKVDKAADKESVDPFANNTLFTADKVAAARARLKSKIFRANAGLDPEILVDGMTIAGAYIESGVRNFKAYADSMVDDFGEGIKPFLLSFWEGARNYPGLDNSGMTSVAESATLNTEIAQNNGEVELDEHKPAVAADNSEGVSDSSERRGNRSQQGDAPGNTGTVDTDTSSDGETLEASEDVGSSGVRDAAKDVDANGRDDKSGLSSDGRQRSSGKNSSDDGAGRKSKPSSVETSPLKSPASVQGDFYMADPSAIVGGGQVARFNKNKAALELRTQLLDDGRKPTDAEKLVLASYTGWGSFGQELFQGNWARPMPKDGWEARDSFLREHLGKAEWEGLQTSIINAHYTDPPVVSSIWNMLEKMGFTGGKVLEPAIGTGNFFGLMPPAITSRSQRAGIELDGVTGSIAQMLYPSANIQIKGYEESNTPDNFYDLVVGNWPFADVSPADRRYNKLAPQLHDYFFLKALDQTRPGGLVVGITSSGTMDKKNSSVRFELAKKGELVAAFRLPTGAFQGYAGTKVVTDIIILRKREKPVELVSDAGWINSEAVDFKLGTAHYNEYYLQHPEHILGDVDFGHGTTFKRMGLIVKPRGDMQAALDGAVSKVPVDAYRLPGKADHINYVANYTDDRQNSLTKNKDGLHIVRGEYLAPAHEVAEYRVKDENKTAKRVAELEALIAMRGAYGVLIDAERNGDTDVEVKRSALRKLYQGFVKTTGALGDSYGLNYLRKVQDPFYPALAALENNQKGKVVPAAILSGSTMRGKPSLVNPSVADAFVLVRSTEINPSMDSVAKLAKMSAKDARQKLIASGAVFPLPNGEVEAADLFTSGNVRQKLREAKQAQVDGNAEMQGSIDKLEKALPADIPYYKIETQMGATWVPAEVYSDYVAHMLARDNADGIKTTYRGGAWKIKTPKSFDSLSEAENGYGSKRVGFNRLVNAAIANQSITLRYKDGDGISHTDKKGTTEVNSKISDIRNKFGEWLWQSPERRVALEREYNEVRNAYAEPSFDGSFLPMEGMALSLGDGPFNLREHQVNAIWRGVATGRSLNAHEVGTGKTFTMAGIALEARRYGKAKKPLLLAHNANSKSVASEIQMMYPGAKVLYVDNLSRANIQTRMMQIANDDWDVVVMPHSLIDRIGFKRETLMGMAQQEIDELESLAYEAADDDGVSLDEDMLNDETALKKLRSPTAKDLVKQRLRILNSIDKMAMAASRENSIAFEDLGIDMVMVDEVHEFKKPPFATKMRMKGLQAQTSNKSIGLFYMAKYIRGMHGGNVHLFTGTPITNTMAEVFHMSRYIMGEEMDSSGVGDWDGWFGSFAREVDDVELTAAGEHEAVTRLQAFINVPELRRMLGQYMDVVFADNMPEMQPRRVNGKILSDSDLTESERETLLNGRTEKAKDRPYKKMVNNSADMSPDQADAFEHVKQLANEWKNMSGKDRKEAMTSGSELSPIIRDGIAEKASFDVRLIDSIEHAGKEGSKEMAPHKDSKPARVVATLAKIYRGHKKATQVVFMGQGMSKVVTRSEGATGNKQKVRYPAFSTLHDMVERLVQDGIPRGDIAIVDGSTSKDKRMAIADMMNTGEIRIVFGSTGSLGVGVNMQRNLRAMHHMDAPWMPGELEQRNGRGHRQGNQWNTVMEYRYLTDKLDGRRWQVLAIKQRFINEFMRSEGENRVIEGDAASDEKSDIMATLSEAAGDPRLLVRAKLQKQIDMLYSRERVHGFAQVSAKSEIKKLDNRVERTQARLQKVTTGQVVENITALIESQKGKAFKAVLDGNKFNNRSEANQYLRENASALVPPRSENIKVGQYGKYSIYANSSWMGDPDISIKVGDEVIESNGPSILSLESELRKFRDEAINEMEGSISKDKTTKINMENVAAEPFHMQDKLQAKVKERDDLLVDMEANPVAPPYWLRTGAPVETMVQYQGETVEVAGHRWTSDGYFVLLAGKEVGTVAAPYMEVSDTQGMALYEEQAFTSPVIERVPVAQDTDDASLKSVGTAKRSNKRVSHSQAQKAYDKFVALMPGLAVDSEKLKIMDYPVHPLTGKPNPDNHDQAAYNVSTGALELYTANIANGFALDKAIYHELLVHRGLGLFGVEAVNERIRVFARARKTDKRFDKLVKKVEVDYKGLPEHIIIEETLARLSENMAAGQVYRAWHQFKQFALKLLNKIEKFKTFLEGRTSIEKAEAMLHDMAKAYRKGHQVKTSDRRDPMSFNPDDEYDAIELGDAMASRGNSGNSESLDMSKKARMKRAEAMGFDTSQVYYHGSQNDISEFIPGRAGTIFFSDDPTYSEGYGKTLYPVFLSIKNPADLIKNSEHRQIVIDAFNEAGGWEAFNEDVMEDRDSPNYDESLDDMWEITDYVMDVLQERGFDAVIQSEDVKDSAYVATGVFEPSRVRSIHAAFESENQGSGKMLASRANSSAGASQIFERIGESVKKKTKALKQQSPKEWIKNLVADSRKNWLALIPRRYFAELSEGAIPSIYSYLKRADQMEADRNHLMKMPAERVNEWRTFNDKDPQGAKALASLMHESTIAGYDPSKDYEPLKDVTRFDGRNFMARDELATGEVITPEYVRRRTKEIKELAKSRSGEGSAKFYERIEHLKNRLAQQANRDAVKPDIDELWAQVSPAGKKVYEKARDAYLEQSNEYQQTLENRIIETVEDERHRASWLAKIRMMFETQKSEGPYFPLQRFGDYFAVVKQGESVLEFVRFEKQSEQRAWMDSRQALLEPRQIIESGKLMQSAGDSLKQVDPEYHAKVMETLDNSGVQAGLMDEVNQLYLAMLPEMSMRKHFIHRKKVAGYNPDALRAFSHNMFHGAYQLSKLKHSHKMEKYLRDMRKEAKTASDANRAADMVVEMEKRHAWAMNPKSSPWAAKATSFGFAWYLGVTPAAAMVNLTQTPMMGLPVLGSRYGYVKAAKALLQSGRDFVGGRGHLDKRLKDHELKAFKEFERSGLIDKTLAHDLAGVSEGGIEYSSTAHKVMSGIAYLFHHAERFNREVTAVAAYRLAHAAGDSHAIKTADSLTKDAHFDYSNGERARFMQNDAAKVLLLFRQHSLNMTYRMARDFNNMFRGVSPAVRKQARRQFAGVMGMGALFAGAAGMPMFTVLGNLLELALDDEDEPWEFETEFRLFLVEHLGEDGAKLAMHGALDTLTGASISSRVGLNNLWLRDPDATLEGRGLVQYYAQQALGPIFGIALSGGTAMSLIQEGQVQRGMEFAMPKVIKDSLRAIRYAGEGVTNFRGDQLIDDVDAVDELYQFLGFTPSSVSEQYEQNRAITSPAKRILKRRQLLMNKFALAKRLDDRELLEEVNEWIDVFNQKNHSVRISAKAKMQSLRRRKSYTKRAENGRMLDPRLAHLAEENRFLAE